ncbi:MAG: YfcE family phosphodiesterase, partial [Pseudomonadota bacterium]
MTSRIGIVSDVHSSPIPLREALELFRKQGVDQIICAGDIAGYFDSVTPVVELLQAFNCQAIVGNHDQSFLEKSSPDDYPLAYQYLSSLPSRLSFEIEGKKILVVHANPPDEQHGGIKLLTQEGDLIEERVKLWCENLKQFDCDVLIVGHTHQVYAEKLGDILVINPGSSVFNHSCSILSLPEMTIETFALEGQDIV